MIKFINNKQNGLIKAIMDYQPTISFAECNKLLRKKDIKVNGKRTSKNIVVDVGDEIVVYNKGTAIDIPICYEDDNLLIVNKPILLEVKNNKGNSLCDLLSKSYKGLIPCNRLDMNTNGLVIFAKNQVSFEAVKQAFDDKKITKVYLTKVFGVPQKHAVLKDYIFKNTSKEMCYIEKNKTSKNYFVQTEYNLISQEEGYSTLQVIIHGGKTHQIRCHLAYYGLSIVGDNKYGDVEKNKKYGYSRQQLTAQKLIFNTDSGFLKYMNNKIIELKKNTNE